MRLSILTLALLLAPVFLSAQSQKLCIKKKLNVNRAGKVAHRRALRVASGDCPRGTVELLDTASFTGPQGAQGPAGDDASSLLYGNGSAGDLLATSNTTLKGPNFNYENITIDAGVRVDVRSGAVIRCTGTFTNNGTLRVYSYSNGGRGSAFLNGLVEKAPGPALISSRVAGAGDCGPAGFSRSGGSGTSGTTPSFLAQYIKLGPLGGGGGASSGAGSGGNGGGTVTILCDGAINNAGTIEAQVGNGSTGSGGGGGGIVILASGTAVNNTGTVSVQGGDGGASNSTLGAGGGGAGGLVHLISPSISAGTIDASGGSAGDDTVDASNDPACAGGAGGGSVGISGGGGSVTGANTSSPASDGNDGGFIETTADPVDVFGAY